LGSMLSQRVKVLRYLHGSRVRLPVEVQLLAEGLLVKRLDSSLSAGLEVSISPTEDFEGISRALEVDKFRTALRFSSVACYYISLGIYQFRK